MQTLTGRFSSPIAKVYFEGWESDTTTLQRAGWDISSYEVPPIHGRPMIRLALRHEKLRLYALTNGIELTMDMIHRLHTMDRPDATFLCFEVITMGGEGQMVTVMGEMPKTVFMPVDTFPEYSTGYSRNYLKDMCIFRTIPTEAPELVVAPEKVHEILDLLLKAQDPKQAEIREKKRRAAWCPNNTEGYNARADIRAQIVSIAG